MISLKKFIHPKDEESLEAYRRATILLLQSIALHAVEGEAGDYVTFRKTLNDLAGGLSEESAPQDVLIAAGTAASAIHEYGRHTTQFIKAQSIELQAMVAMLTRTMSEISTSSDQSISRLQEIEQKLAKAAVIDDLRTLKIRMSECLETVRSECIRQKRASLQTIEGLRAGMSQVEEQKSGIQGQRDPSTGLPCRQQAEAELRKAITSGKRVFAAIFVVDRIPAIILRFGHAVADEAMGTFFGRLTAATGASDQLFRWAESSFLAILERQYDLAATHRELNQHFLQKCNRAFELGTRSVLLPISASWLVLDASGKPSGQVVADIDSFVSKTVVSF